MVGKRLVVGLGKFEVGEYRGKWGGGSVEWVGGRLILMGLRLFVR